MTINPIRLQGFIPQHKFVVQASCNLLNAVCRRDFTVPTGMFNISAMSLYFKPVVCQDHHLAKKVGQPIHAGANELLTLGKLQLFKRPRISAFQQDNNGAVSDVVVSVALLI